MPIKPLAAAKTLFVNEQRRPLHKAASTFLKYRDMNGDRSIRKACESSSKVGFWGKWSATNNWLKRCKAYDAEVERLSWEASVEDILNLERERLLLAMRRARFEIELHRIILCSV